MTTHTDPITNAVRLLHEWADSMQQAYDLLTKLGYQNAAEALDARQQRLAAAQALQDFAESLGAGGVQPLISRQNAAQAPADQARAAIKTVAADGPPGSGGWQFHAEEMERQRDHWRQRAQTMHEHQAGQVWYWQGDGYDNPESMVNSLPVVIRADQLRALLSEAKAPQQAAPAVGNSGFDHKTAADFLAGKTVSDEAMRKFVAASRWAHDDRAGLQVKLQSVRDELASREAEIASLKAALMNAEAAPQQAAPGLVPLADVLARVDACAGPGSAVRLALEREFGQPAA